jgi:hypothetical protein
MNLAPEYNILMAHVGQIHGSSVVAAYLRMAIVTTNTTFDDWVIKLNHGI